MLSNIVLNELDWGFLYDDNKGEAEIAPVFDCGSCLLPQADDQVMRNVLANKSELHARVFQFPTSAIKLNGRKINYYDFLSHAENDDAVAALKRMAPRIDMEKIEHFIDQVPAISDLQKAFYKRYISARFDQIIRPAFELAMAMEQEEIEPTMTM